MNVLLDLGDVTHLHFCTRCRHQLHDTNRTDMAAGSLIQLGLLVALCRQHHGVKTILVTVFFEQVQRGLKPFPLRAFGRILKLLDTLHGLNQTIVDQAIFRHPVLMEVFNFRSQSQTVFTHHPACSGVITQNQVVTNLDLGENLRPHFGFPIIDNDQ